MKKLLLISACILLSCTGTNYDEKIAETNESKKALYTLQKNKNSEKEYDLEQTIKIINALQEAKTKSNSSKEFLFKLASQDYSKVANDVIEAKEKLIPILNRLQHEESKLENAKDLWKNFIKISSVAMDQGSKIALKASISGGADPSMLANVSNAAKETINIIKENEDLKEEIRYAIEDIEYDYLKYLKNFTPVYYSYLKKWDKVCLYRDNAYLSINQRDIESAMFSLDKVLKLNPNDKEAKIMKSMCLLYKHQKEQLYNKETIKIRYDKRAKLILDEYLRTYPDQSAPALLLLGTYHKLNDNKQKAINYYNQSAIEYPRQAQLLLDMFNSYKKRTYIRKSAEGHYILKLYNAMMQGFGIFSPNFQKSLIAYNNGNIKKSKEEIQKHFFRRSNQGVYDYLISDMNYCNEYLPKSFDLIFKEKYFLDLNVNDKMFNSDKLSVSIKNNSDVELSNIRLFLCVHFTDMYKSDYQVFKIDKTINKVKPEDEVDFGDVEFDFELYGKQKSTDDIVNARAIILTDNYVSWIDEKDFKIQKAEKAYRDKGAEEIKDYISHLGLTKSSLFSFLSNKSIVNFSESYVGKDGLTIKLPRQITGLNPIFSINELNSSSTVLPVETKIDGSFIKLKFDYNLKENIDFFINAEHFGLKLELNKKDGDFNISEDIEIL